MFATLRRLLGLSRYRIIHDPELGYCPAYNMDLYGWVAIDKRGEESQAVDCIAKPLWRGLWVDTKEEAGARINKHATDRGRAIVWEG